MLRQYGFVPGSVKQDVVVKAIHCQRILWMVLLKLQRTYSKQQTLIDTHFQTDTRCTVN